MKLDSKFTVQCHCGETKAFDLELNSLYYALRHIKRCHNRLYARINKEGREAAKSREGLGYLDSDWPLKQMATFRDAWRVKALERMLREDRAR